MLKLQQNQRNDPHSIKNAGGRPFRSLLSFTLSYTCTNYFNIRLLPTDFSLPCLFGFTVATYDLCCRPTL